jgi:hypothetical protein
MSFLVGFGFRISASCPLKTCLNARYTTLSSGGGFLLTMSGADGLEGVDRLQSTCGEVYV